MDVEIECCVPWSPDGWQHDRGRPAIPRGCLMVARSLVLFAIAAVAEIGGAWMVWQGLRDDRGWPWVVAGGLALAGYGAIATLQPEAEFGRVFAAYGGIFIAGSILWGMAFEGFRPDRWDLIGATVCLAGMAIIMYAPRT